MRIAQIAPPWFPMPPKAYGDTELVVQTLVEELTRLGHHVQLIAHPDSEMDVSTYSPQYPGKYPKIGTAVPEAAYVLDAYHYLRQHRFHVIHDHTHLGPLLGMGAGMTGNRVVTTAIHL